MNSRRNAERTNVRALRRDGGEDIRRSLWLVAFHSFVVKRKRSGEKLEWTAVASAAAAMQKGEEPISEPNWAAKRPLVRPSLQFGVEMWLVMFPNENGGREENTGEGENRFYTETEVTIAAAAFNINRESQTRIRRREQNGI